MVITHLLEIQNLLFVFEVGLYTRYPFLAYNNSKQTTIHQCDKSFGFLSHSYNNDQVCFAPKYAILWYCVSR